MAVYKVEIHRMRLERTTVRVEARGRRQAEEKALAKVVSQTDEGKTLWLKTGVKDNPYVNRSEKVG
jgi:hypothetical protein